MQYQSSELFMYDVSSKAWNKINKDCAPSPRSNHMLTSINLKIYCSPIEGETELWEFCILKNEWRQITTTGIKPIIDNQSLFYG